MIKNYSINNKALQTFVVFSFLILFAGKTNSQTFYDVNTIQKIEISFSSPNWDFSLDTAIVGSEGYLLADSVKINGIVYDSVGVKYKGNSSYNSTYVKNPLHISLSEYKSHSYQGYKDIKLSNCYSDPSMIREVLSYAILNNYMDAPKSNFAQLYINGSYIGLYSNDESINKKFCSEHFYSSQNTFIKCNPIVNPSPNTKCNLRFLPSVDSTGYFNYYEVKSTYGWNDLVELCDTVTNSPSSLSTILDVDRAIWMLSFDNVLINLDSYMGAFAQNYYLYKDNTHHFNPVIWDLNMSFGGFSYIGVGSSSLGNLTLANMQQLPLTIHSTDIYWPLINDIMTNPTYKKMYVAHMRTIVNEMFANNSYATIASQLQATIDTAVQSDVNNFFTYSQFQNGMTGNVTVGSNVVPGISNLMTARVAYLQNTVDFNYATPIITAITPDNVSPAINSSVTITAHVSNANANAVYFGSRFHNDLKFERVQMFDDGAHNDGAAGDSVYGATFTMSSIQMQYYIYAENNNAGIFSPERAEHEFYTLQSSTQTAAPGQIVINEFLANNQTGTTNEFGQFADWIELYNITSNPLSLYGLYLSDSYTNPTKFAFPDNVYIPANGYLTIWADQGVTTSTYLHSNFQLSSVGEQLILSNASGAILDSISFGSQSPDVSIGRCPNGTGSFVSMNTPTCNASNCTNGIAENGTGQDNIIIYPNPSNGIINIQLKTEKENTVRVYNSIGQMVYEIKSLDKFIPINLSSCSTGLYLLNINNKYFSPVQIIK